MKGEVVSDRGQKVLFVNIFSPALTKASPKPQRQYGLERKYQLQVRGLSSRVEKVALTCVISRQSWVVGH